VLSRRMGSKSDAGHAGRGITWGRDFTELFTMLDVYWSII
jgi:hypothetical protein